MGGISYCDPECWHGFKLVVGGILFVFGVVDLEEVEVSDELPKWPEAGGFEFDERSALLAANELLRKRAAYWEARCRMAVEHIRHDERCMTPFAGDRPKVTDYNCTCGATAALKLIGPLPDSK